MKNTVVYLLISLIANPTRHTLARKHQRFKTTRQIQLLLIKDEYWSTNLITGFLRYRLGPQKDFALSTAVVGKLDQFHGDKAWKEQ